MVLIESQLPSSSGPPVLSRTVSAQAMPAAQFGVGFAQLQSIQLPAGQSAPAQGNTVILSGTGLGTVTHVLLSNPRLGIQYTATPNTPVSDSSVSFTVPNEPNNLPAGAYSVAVTYTDTSGAPQNSNSLPMGIAPAILTTPTPVTNASGSLVTITCNPDVSNHAERFPGVGFECGSRPASDDSDEHACLPVSSLSIGSIFGSPAGRWSGEPGDGELVSHAAGIYRTFCEDMSAKKATIPWDRSQPGLSGGGIRSAQRCAAAKPDAPAAAAVRIERALAKARKALNKLRPSIASLNFLA